MKRTLRALAAGSIGLALGWSAHATTVSTSANLSGATENPPNTSAGTGTALVILDTTTHQLRVRVTFSGLSGTTSASHIHCCTTAPNNAPVATVAPAFPGFPIGVTSGTYDQTLDTSQAATWNGTFIANNGGTTAGAEAALANGLATGQAYLNVHTTVVPGGEIRGFLSAQAPTPVNSAIPTLSEWGLAGLALLLAGATAWTVRRRRA